MKTRTLILIATAEQIGVRDGRRILGRYQLTKDDLLKGARFDDGVALVTFNVHKAATPRSTSVGATPAPPIISTQNNESQPNPKDIP